MTQKPRHMSGADIAAELPDVPGALVSRACQMFYMRASASGPQGISV